MPSDLESGSQARTAATKTSSSKLKNIDEMPVTLKVTFEDAVRRHRLSLRDMGAATLERRVSRWTTIPISPPW